MRVLKVMKRRILFVEDNPVLLQLYGMMLEGQEDWEVVTADRGEAALQFLEATPFDVVVSDLRMPGMDGVQLIHEVRERYPRTSRIILSGLSDQQEIAECLGDTHQFLAKPFTAKALKGTLTRLCGLDTYLQDEALRSLAGRLGNLPSFPTLYLDIMQELATAAPSLENIANIVAQDPAMTAKVLQISNSAAFGLERQVHSPFDAVQYIGTSIVRSLALSAHVFATFESAELRSFSITRLWDHALKTAMLARAILRTSGAEPPDVEDAYTAGMLHDIGKMVLAANLPEPFQAALRVAREKKCPLHEAEQNIFGANHAGVGAYLLGLWGLPAAIVEAVAFHHTPGLSEERRLGALAAVHIASALEHELQGAEPEGEPAALDRAFLAAAGLQDQLDSWRSEANRLFATPEV